MGCNLSCYCNPFPSDHEVDLSQEKSAVKKTQHEADTKTQTSCQTERPGFREDHLLKLGIPTTSHVSTPSSLNFLSVSSPHTRSRMIEETRDDSVVFEGNLKRYRPGPVRRFLDRWGVLTRKEFLCYKGRKERKLSPKRPLLSVQISNILNVSR